MESKRIEAIFFLFLNYSFLLPPKDQAGFLLGCKQLQVASYSHGVCGDPTKLLFAAFPSCFHRNLKMFLFYFIFLTPSSDWEYTPLALPAQIPHRGQSDAQVKQHLVSHVPRPELHPIKHSESGALCGKTPRSHFRRDSSAVPRMSLKSRLSSKPGTGAYAGMSREAQAASLPKSCTRLARVRS